MANQFRTDLNPRDVRNLPGSENLVPREFYKPTYNPTFWEDPSRVTRYREQSKRLTGNVPPQLEAAYQYFRITNNNRPVYMWEHPRENDPIRGMLQRLPVPKLEEMDDIDREYFTTRKAADNEVYSVPLAQAQAMGLNVDQLQRQGDNVIVPATSLYEPQPSPDGLVYGMPKEQYDSLAWWQKSMLAITPTGSGGMAQNAAQGAAAAGAQGAAMGLLSGGLGGAAAGGLFGGALGGVFGAGAGNETAEKAMGVLQFLDAGAEHAERAIGLAAQIANSMLDPTHYGPVSEIFDNLSAAYQAGHVAENVASFGSMKYDPTKGETTLYAYELTDPKPKETVYKDNIDPSALMLAEARKRIIQGESMESIEADLRSRVGMAYDVREAIGHMVIDPLNLLALGEAKLLGAAAKLTKNTQLLDAVKIVDKLNDTRNIFNKEGAIEVARQYGRNLRLLKPDELKRFGWLSRVLAGVDADGIPKEYNPAQKANFIERMLDQTPQSKANATLQRLAQGMDMAIHEAQTPQQIRHIINAVAGMKPGDAVRAMDDAPMMTWFESAEAQPAPAAVKAAQQGVVRLLDAYDNAAPARASLEELAQAASTPEKPVTINDLVRMFGEADTPEARNNVYRALAQTVQENVGKGLVPQDQLGRILQFGDAPFSEAAKMFFGPDGLPYTDELLKAHVSRELARGMEDWAIKYFDVKPTGWVERMSNAVKSFQTLTMLNSPTYIANNTINNMMTLAWDGLIGVNTSRGRQTWLRAMGFDPGTMRRGATSADLGAYEVEQAVRGGKKASRVYRMGEMIRAKLNSNRSDVERNLATFANWAAVFPRISQKVEQASSEMAYYASIRPYWDATWVPGRGFDPMSKEFKQLAQYLDGIMPGMSKRIEKAVARSKSRAEIEKMLFNGFESVGLKDVLKSEDMETLNTAFPGMVDEIDNGLKTAKTPAAVRDVLGKAKQRVIKEIRKETTRQARAKAERLLTRVNLEGPAGGMAEMDQVVGVRTDAHAAHFDRMQTVADEIEEAQLMGNERAARWAKARAEEDEIYRAVDDDHAAKWLGLYQALGSTDEDAAQMLALLGEGSGPTMGLHSNWRQFFEDTSNAYADYHNLADGLDKAGRAQLWAETSQKINKSYFAAVLEEDRIMARLDELTANLYARGKPNEVAARADMMKWRLSLREARREQAAVMCYYRSGEIPAGMEDWASDEVLARVKALTRGDPLYKIAPIERAVINKAFYRDIYLPLNTKIAQVGHETQPKAPKAAPVQPAQPAQPTVRQAAPKVDGRTSVDQSPVWQRVNEVKPELAGVDADGNFTQGAKQEVKKWVNQYSGAKVRRFDDITPEMVDLAARNEAMRKQVQPNMLDADENARLRQDIERRTQENADLRKRIDELEQESRQDERGSGALNFRAFEQDMLKRQARKQDTTIGFFDIRGLGKTNKVFGDAVGDAYLKALVREVQAQGMDVYRKGGDEFLVLGDNDATLRAMMDEIQARFERGIIETGGKKYAGAKFHYGTGSTVADADAASLAALNADPNAEQFRSKQYTLTELGENTDTPGGMGSGTDLGTGEAGQAAPGELEAIERAAATLREDGTYTAGQPELDADTARTLQEMGDYALVNEQTGEVFTPDMVTADDLLSKQADDIAATANPKERRYVHDPVNKLPSQVREAMQREAQQMLSEVGKGFAPVVYETDEAGRITGRKRDYQNVRPWYTGLEDEPQRAQRVRSALKRIILGTEDSANDSIKTYITRIKSLILDEMTRNADIDTLLYTGDTARLWEAYGENITALMQDPATSADTLRQQYGANAGDMMRLWEMFNVEDDASAGRVVVNAADLDEQALRIADNIDNAESVLEAEDSFAYGREAIERELMDAMPEDGDIALQLLDTLAENFNPEYSADEIYKRLGIRMGGEFEGEEGLKRATNTPEFKRWFGDSKVVDENGEPLVVYHGTGADFNTFKISETGKTDSNWYGRGFYFTPNPDVANQYAAYGKPNVMPVYLRLENPADWRAEYGRSLRGEGGDVAAFDVRDELIKKGYDGVFVYDDVIKGSLTDDQWYKLSSWYSENRPGLRITRDDVDEIIKRGVKFGDFASYFGHEIAMSMPKERTLVEIVAFESQQIKSVFNQGSFDVYDPSILKRTTFERVDGLTTFTESGKSLMRIYSAKDPTTVAHEAVHALTPLMTQADADALRTGLLADLDVPDDWHTTMKYADSGDQLTAVNQDAYERVARAFEKYLADGQAPNSAVERLFARMKDWMLRVYRKITGSEIDMQLSDETRAVFDRWMGGREVQPEPVKADPTPDTPAPSLWEKRPQQSGLFQQGEDTPLFSGTPQRAQAETFNPQETGGQDALFDMREQLPQIEAKQAGDTTMPQGGLFRRNQYELPIGTTDQLAAPPHDEAALEVLRNKIMPMLDDAERQLAGDVSKPNRVMDTQKLPPEQMRMLKQYLGKVGSQMGDAKLAALRYGEAKRDFALLPYQRRYNWDTYLQAIMPYEFWFTRSMGNWMIRAANRPQIIANYMRLQEMFDKQSKRDGFPTRLKKKGFIRMPFLPDWMGGGIYTDPYKQIFPFLQLANPFERLSNQENQASKKAESLLNQMLQDGDADFTEREIQDALQNRSGLVWQQALAQARNEMDADIQNPVDFARNISGFSLPLNIVYLYMMGREDEISQLPVTRLVQNATAPFGIGGERGFNMEGGIRRIAGLPEVDRYEDYRVDRMLANLAAEGLITADEAQRAMIDREGPAFQLAQKRVSTLGSIQYLGAPIAADFFPEGEQEQRALYKEYGTAYSAFKNGDKGAINRFFEAHPEYQARLASFQKPEERMKRFLIAEVWDGYNKLPQIHKRQAREQLGRMFTDAFVNKETRSYDSIDTETLAMWAKMMGRVNPQKAPDVPNMPLQLAPENEAQAVDAYYKEQNERFPGVGDALRAYYDMTPEEQAQFNATNPQINGYYRWRTQYLAQHPDVIPWVTSESSELFGAPKDVQAFVYQYRAQKDQQFPGVDQMQDEYFSLPQNQRRGYIRANPQLSEFWDWKRQVAAAMPNAAPYILSDQSLRNSILGEDAPAYFDLSNVSQGTQMQIEARRAGTWRLGDGARAELREWWEKNGKPGGTFSEFLKQVVEARQ